MMYAWVASSAWMLDSEVVGVSEQPLVEVEMLAEVSVGFGGHHNSCFH